jgi:hypothetical protein
VGCEYTKACDKFIYVESSNKGIVFGFHGNWVADKNEAPGNKGIPVLFQWSQAKMITVTWAKLNSSKVEACSLIHIAKGASKLRLHSLQRVEPPHYFFESSESAYSRSQRLKWPCPGFIKIFTPKSPKESFISI